MARFKSPASSRSNPFPAILPVTAIVVAYTGTPGLSAAMAAGVSLVRLYATTDCHVKIGAAPVAAATDTPVAAKTETFFMVDEGNKISVIQDASGGNLFITPAAVAT